jgi:hypothetical protein
VQALILLASRMQEMTVFAIRSLVNGASGTGNRRVRF